MSKPKKSDYETLRDEWYAKLEKDGFKDIEQDEDSLKKWSSKFYQQIKNLSHEVIIAKANYYQMAANFLEEYKFDSEVDRIIWEYHADGMAIREIAETLNKSREKKTNRDAVWKTIKTLKVKMYTMYVVEMQEYHE